MTDSNAAQFSNNQVWWAQTPLPKISSQSISGRLKFCCETCFRGFTFFGYVLALSVVFRTRIHENPRDALQLRMFDWFIWICCGQCYQMAQHFPVDHMFAEHLKSSKKVQAQVASPGIFQWLDPATWRPLVMATGHCPALAKFVAPNSSGDGDSLRTLKSAHEDTIGSSEILKFSDHV